ncbi:hypothetical protein RCL1_009045 [Eukaryota sp. TZLM3-RCL]
MSSDENRTRTALEANLNFPAFRNRIVEIDETLVQVYIITVARTSFGDQIVKELKEFDVHDSLRDVAYVLYHGLELPPLRYFYRNSLLNTFDMKVTVGNVYRVQSQEKGPWFSCTDVADLLPYFSELQDSSLILEQLDINDGVIPLLLVIDETKLQNWHVHLPVELCRGLTASGRAKSGELIRKDHEVIHDGHHILDLDDHYYLHPVLSTKAVAVFCDEILSNNFDPSLLQLAHKMIGVCCRVFEDEIGYQNALAGCFTELLQEVASDVQIIVAPPDRELPDIQILKEDFPVSADDSLIAPTISSVLVKEGYSVGDERHQNSIYCLKRFGDKMKTPKTFLYKRSLLNLNFRGPKLEVCVVSIQNNKPIIEPLFLWDFSSNFQFGHTKAIRNLLIFLTAFRNYVRNVLQWEPETTDEFQLQRRIFSRVNFLPFISSCPSFEEGSELVFKICGQIKRNVFWALMKASDEEETVVIVSITRSYCYEAHYFLSTLEIPELASGQTSSFAPKLLGGQRLAGYYVVVMEPLEHGYSPITEELSVEKCRVLKSLLENLLKHFHAQNMVHGDFRGSNIFCNEHNFVKIIDFEWSGRSDVGLPFSDKVEEFSSRVLKPLKLDCPMKVPTYTLIINEQIKWPDGVAGGEEIKQHHDLANLEELETMKKTRVLSL